MNDLRSIAFWQGFRDRTSPAFPTKVTNNRSRGRQIPTPRALGVERLRDERGLQDTGLGNDLDYSLGMDKVNASLISRDPERSHNALVVVPMPGKKNSPNAGSGSGLGGPAQELDSRVRQLEKEYERAKKTLMKKIVPSAYILLISIPLLIAFALLQLGQASLEPGTKKALANVSSYVVLGIFLVCASGYLKDVAVPALKMHSLNQEITKARLALQTVLGHSPRNP